MMEYTIGKRWDDLERAAADAGARASRRDRERRKVRFDRFDVDYG